MRVNKNIVWRKVGNDALVLLDLETGRYNTLNPSATLIWGAAARGESLEGCAKVLTQQYRGLTEGQALDAARGLIEQFQQRQILVEGEPSADLNTADSELPKTGEFQPPCCQEHEALQEITAGTYRGEGASHSGGYTYYYYYYYYY